MGEIYATLNPDKSLSTFPRFDDPEYLQSELLVPARVESVRLNGGRPYEFGGQRASQTIPVFPHPAVLPLKAQLEAVVFPEFLVIGLRHVANADGDAAAARV